MKRKITTSTVLLLIITLVLSGSTFACTDIVVGKNASTDGSVITSHTVDGRYDSRIQIIPAQDHKAGTMAPVYENIVYADHKDLVKLGEIPEVEHTYKYFHGAYPYANEHQLIIGETTIVGAPETANSDEAIMTIEQLEVFALQRCKTAREAVKLMGKLAEEYGFRESCYRGECLTVTDPNEAWVFEVFGVGPMWTKDSGKPGAVWAAKKVPDDHVTVVPNFSRIRKINPDSEDMMVSDNYLQVAEELGLYDPHSKEEFYWNEVYGDVKGETSLRLWRVYSEMAPSKSWDYNKAAEYPFSIKADKKISVHDVIAMFRDTSKDSPYDMTEDEGWYYKDDDGKMIKSVYATPQADDDMRNLLDIEYYRPIARYYCSYFFVSQARSWLPDEIGGVVWFGLDNPENSPFIPMYVGIEDVPTSWKTLNRDKFDRDSAWWAFAQVDDFVNLRYGELREKVDSVLNPMQNHIFELQDQIEEKAMILNITEDQDAVKELLTNHTNSLMHWTENRYWKLADELYYEINNNNN
ncbi:dipeptidase [Halanaerobium sp. DL-01]|uniref:dipeptidase n=1 Tax=Halanaerobium sp. DL-01 TaxID=1653064 RepID=UPI000DF202A7|nr:C69 family dipeptidase [Halanaerobium sp. DL-01]RCW88480.1 dipeptidase [Halanaerobium sp. DL-01]